MEIKIVIESQKPSPFVPKASFCTFTCLSPAIVTFNKLVENEENLEEILKNDPKYSNLRDEEHSALQELVMNPEITICNADKGGAVVVLDTESENAGTLEQPYL